MRVLIVGAGIAGLALATAVRRPDVEVEVVERTDLQPSGTGLYLPANAVRALRRLGIGPAVAARGNPIRRQRLLDHRGRVLADLDLARIWGGVDDCLAIHRADLHDLLTESAKPISVRLETPVVGVVDSAPAHVTFADGTSGTYDLVVGADGVHSTIRGQILGGAPARSVGLHCWRFVADGFPDITDWTVMLGRGISFLTVALGGGRVYCYADANTGVLTPGPAGRIGAVGADWRERFTDFAGHVPQLLGHASGAYYAPVEEVAPPIWVGQRVALIGDAAHATSPNMAQGAAMAVEDALVLADALDTSRTIERALITFKARRAKRIAWVQKQTHRRDRTRSLPAPVRNSTLRFAAERMFTSQFAPLREQP